MMKIINASVIAALLGLMLAVSTYGNDEESKVVLSYRKLMFCYASVGEKQVAPGYLDNKNTVFYQYHGILLKGQDMPELAGISSRLPILDPVQAKISIIEVKAPIVVIVGGNEKYDVGYFMASQAVLYRWKGVSLSKEQAQKVLPFEFKNAIDAKKLELKVVDMSVSDEVKAEVIGDKKDSAKPASDKKSD